MSATRFPAWQFPVAAASLALAIGLRVAATRDGLTLPLPESNLPLPVGYARLMALSFDSLAADVLWIRFLQAVPLAPADEPTGRSLSDQLNTVVELDPSFHSAYIHGSTLLTVLGNQPCSALSVLEKGIDTFPGDWRMEYEAGYICFAEIGDPACAAQHMRRSAETGQSQPWLPALVARLLAESSQKQAAVDYLESQLAQNTTPEIHDRFLHRLQEAVLSRDLESIDNAVRTWRLSHDNAVPDSVAQVVADGLLPRVPDDPFGGHYIVKRDGRAASTTGHAGLTVFKNDNARNGTLLERIVTERVEGRMYEFLGKPYWVRTPLDSIPASAGVADGVVQGLETTLMELGATTVEDDYRGFQARAMISHDVDRMQRAQLELLREAAARRPALDQIEERAGVPATDPFGDRYILDERGIPAPGLGRQPLVAVSSGIVRHGMGAHPCR